MIVDPSDDPTRAAGRWDSLFALLRRLDADIEQFYERRGVKGMRSRFALPMIRLAHDGPLTIRQLAASLDRTHSAVSQTVSAMREAGMVQTVPGEDARTRLVVLTERGHELIPLLEAEWRATEAAVAELDDETATPLSEIVAALTAAVDRLPMSARLDAHLDERGTAE
ncbi:MAG: MarR family winged helix-turn-helix transcriptional regulator [Leifsonia sp.]|uniref:MarR family winged helix-turn-helix transcriptional regulator n=1 Tax=Leifsonia sp. TaxID=1870902 RepID=UPI003F7D12C1